MAVKRFIASWCAASAVILLLVRRDFTFKEYADALNIFAAAGVIAFFFAAVSAIRFFSKRAEVDDWFLAASVGLYALVTVWRYSDFYFYIGVMLIVAILCVYLAGTDRLKLSGVELKPMMVIAAVGAVGIFCFVFIAVQTCYRYWTYSTPNFDFGIFVNMFYNMKKSLLPLTTCERDGLLSHFAVHISPIYYLILPFYALFPYQETLQIAQAAIVASAIIPLYKLAKIKGLSGKATLAVCVMFSFYPAVYGGCFYDLHENCFLTPLLLWLFYFIEREKWPPVYIFALLTLTVKEDAPAYIVFVGLFLLISRRKYLHGAILTVSAVGYFIGAAFLLNKYGLGIMATRYANYITGDGGLISMALNLLRDPALVISESFNSDKLLFAAQMLLPLAFLPFATRDPSRLLLLLPMLLINLMTDYTYQYSIYFQYVFGVTAFLFYSVVLNLADMTVPFRRTLASCAVMGSILLFCSEIVDRSYYVNKYDATDFQIVDINEALETIPDDASVQASTFLLPKLAQRDVIYELDTAHKTEYIAIDLRYEKSAYEDAIVEAWENRGYEVVDYREAVVAVLRDPEWED